MFRIMVVEDESRMRRSIVEKINRSDKAFKVVGEYENGSDALLEIELLKPHVVLSDIRMPIMDGLTLLKKVKERYPGLLTVLLSGYPDFEYAREAIALQVEDYLLKPATHENIGKLLDNLRDKLLNNDKLIQSEVLQKWAYPIRAGLDERENAERLGQELFYHAEYLLVYSACAVVNAPQAMEESDLLPFLESGEEIYSIPAVEGTESIWVIGIHRCNEERIQRLKATMAAGDNNRMTTSVVIRVQRLKSELNRCLLIARNVFREANLVEDSNFFYLDEQRIPEFPGMTLPLQIEQALSRCVKMKNEQEFWRQLQAFFATEDMKSASRNQWVRALQFLARAIARWHDSDLMQVNIPVMDRELEEAVWQSDRLASLETNIKEVLAQLFEASADQGEKKDPWIDQLKRFLQNNYRTELSLSEIAEQFDLNPKYMIRAFKRETSVTPWEYVIGLRIDEAKRLIKEQPRLLFKDIAELVGYSDPYYFSKLFKKATNVTPTEYKRI